MNATLDSTLLKQAAEWRLISVLLERPRQSWQSEVRALSREISDPDLQSAADHASEATEEAYLALLGPGGVCSPREVGYAGMEDPGHLLFNIVSFYQAFSYKPESEDPPDHISVETGFAAYLLLKEAYAKTSDSFEAVNITQSSLTLFYQEHLARLAYGIAAKLPEAAPLYIRKAIESLCSRLSEFKVVPIEPVEEAPACGATASCRH